MSDRITRRQIARIWATAHALGMDKEMLYLLVPRGSITAMSRQEAAELIEHLDALGGKRVGPANSDPLGEAPPARRRNPNAATAEQRHFIYFLLGKLGWLEQPHRVRGFLTKYAHVPTVEDIRGRKRASAIIEALKAMHRRLKAGTSDAQRN